jgi:hypothetical protein
MDSGRRRRWRRRLALAALALVLPIRAPADGVAVFVVREHGVGNALQAQPYLDRFIALATELNGWESARGTYFTSRALAEAQIPALKPHYAILSLGAFLELRKKHRMKVVGHVEVWHGGGKQYFLVSKAAADLKSCKSKRLSSDHAGDPRFVERVVANGAFTLKDFVPVAATRPLQPIKQVLAGEADCALIDDAQRAELSHIEGGADLHVVWASRELPPMVVAAFPNVAAAERQRLQDSMGKVCAGEAKAACNEVGILSLKPASDEDYADVVALYGE